MSLSGTGSSARGELVGERQRPAAHLRPVLDRLPHVGEHPLQLVAQLRRARRRRGPGRSRSASSSRPCRRRSASSGSTSARDLDQRARAARGAPRPAGAPAGATSRLAGGERGGDRVDQERHVVGDDLDDGVVLVGGGRVMRSFSSPGSRCCGQLAVRPGGVEHLLGGEADQLLVGREPPEAVDQRRRVVVVAGQRDRLGRPGAPRWAPARRARRPHVVGQRLVGSPGRRGVDARPVSPVTPCRAAVRPVGRRIELSSRPRRLPESGPGLIAGRRSMVPLPSTHHAVGHSAAQPRPCRSAPRRRTTAGRPDRDSVQSPVAGPRSAGSDTPLAMFITRPASSARRSLRDGRTASPYYRAGQSRPEGRSMRRRTPSPPSTVAGRCGAGRRPARGGALAACSSEDGPERDASTLPGRLAHRRPRRGRLRRRRPASSSPPADGGRARSRRSPASCAADPAGAERARASRRSPRTIATAAVKVDWTLPGGDRGRTRRTVRLHQGRRRRWQVIWEPAVVHEQLDRGRPARAAPGRRRRGPAILDGAGAADRQAAPGGRASGVAAAARSPT